MIRCALCGEAITEPRKAWKQQIGWVNPRGAKAMTGAKQTGELAHPECIVRLRLKMPAAQGTLV